MRNFFWRTTAIMSLALASLVTASCGSEQSSDNGSEEAKPSVSFPAPAASTTYTQLLEKFGAGPTLAPSVSVLTAGSNRFAFALFNSEREQLTEASVAIYTADAKGRNINGPLTAGREPLDVKSQFRSRSTASDSDNAQVIYVRQLELTAKAKMVFAVVSLDGELSVTEPVPLKLTDSRRARPPLAGERAVSVSTPTLADVAGDAEQIDTRIPASSMHSDDLVDVLGKKPVVLLFATPALCQSQVCGPVVDIAEQVKADYQEDVSFIHMEIYRDNDVSKGFRPQITAWRLPTEPWLFVIDAQGRVVEALEGAYSVRELNLAVKRAL